MFIKPVLILAFHIFQLNYYMDQLDMVDTYFKILPWVLVGSGILAFLVSTAGFIFSSTVEVQYRVTHLLDSNLPLTSKTKVPYWPGLS